MSSGPRRQRSFGLRLLLGGVLVVCLQSIVFLLILDDTVGGVSLRARATPRDPSMARQATVVVLRSGATAAQWGSPERYDQRVRAWREALDTAGLDQRVVGDGQLESALRTATVLVLPGAACLDDAARRAILGFVDSGGGVVASGAAGTRDGRCAWQGWGFLSRITQVGDFDSVGREGTFAAFRGGQFYDGAVPPGYRLELPFQELVVAPVAAPDAYWSDWRLRPARGTRTDSSALAVHASVGKRRVVWFGFDESAHGRSRDSQEVLEGYLARAAAWAGHEPIGTLPAWPAARTMAALVSVLVGDDGASLRALARTLEQAGVPATYVSDAKHAAGLRTVRAPELAVAVSRATTTVEQAAAARARLEQAAGGSVRGIEMPGGIADPALRSDLAEAGFTYSLDEIAGLRASPAVALARPSLLSLRPPRELVRVFRTAAEHEEVLASYQGSSEETSLGFAWDFERVRQLGGLYPLALRSDLFAEASRQPLEELLQRLRGAGVWATTGSALADWWSARRLVSSSVRRLSPYRLQLDVGNHGHADLKDLPVFVHLGYRPERVALRSPVFRLALPKCTLLDGVPLLRLDFPEVRAQTNYTFVVSLDE